MGKQRDKATVLTEVNQEILLIARESPSVEPLWGFYCECGQAQHQLRRAQKNLRKRDG